MGGSEWAIGSGKGSVGVKVKERGECCVTEADVLVCVCEGENERG